MTLVAIALVLLLLIVTHLFMRELRAREHVHQRHLDLLINQLLHATGKTWTPPPVDEERWRRTREEREQAAQFVVSPEQFPVD